MKYIVIAEYVDNKITTKVNDIEELFLEAERHRDCDHLSICDVATGEVLIRTGDKPYCTEEFALTVTDWLMARHWGDSRQVKEKQS